MNKIEGKIVIKVKTLAADYGFLPLSVDCITIKQANSVTYHYPKKPINVKSGDYFVLVQISKKRNKPREVGRERNEKTNNH